VSSTSLKLEFQRVSSPTSERRTDSG